jgi:hypothetical protein
MTDRTERSEDRKGMARTARPTTDFIPRTAGQPGMARRVGR